MQNKYRKNVLIWFIYLITIFLNLSFITVFITINLQLLYYLINNKNPKMIKSNSIYPFGKIRIKS